MAQMFLSHRYQANYRRRLESERIPYLEMIVIRKYDFYSSVSLPEKGKMTL